MAKAIKEIPTMKILHDYNQVCKNFSSSSEYFYYNGYFHSKEGSVLHYVKVKEEQLKNIFSYDTVYTLNGSEIYAMCTKLSKPAEILIHQEDKRVYLLPGAVGIDIDGDYFKNRIKDFNYLPYVPFPDLVIQNEFIEYDNSEMIDITKDVSAMIENRMSKQTLKVGEIVLIWTKNIMVSFKGSEKVYIKYDNLGDDVYLVTLKHTKTTGDYYYRFKIINVDLEHTDK